MTVDYVHVPRRPTPEELLARLVEFVPGFRAAWKDSLFIEQDGSFTVHGVFSEFSHYVRAHFTEFDEATWKGLFRYVEQCATADDQSEFGVASAVCTCFLEDIAGEGMPSRVASPYMGPESKKYFDRYDHPR